MQNDMCAAQLEKPEFELYYVTIRAAHLRGDGITPTAPKTLAQHEFVFWDKLEFERFLAGSHFAALLGMKEVNKDAKH